MPFQSSPLALNRFPAEIQNMIMALIESQPKGDLFNMILTSQAMYDHFTPILYHTLNLNSDNAKQIFHGLCLDHRKKRSADRIYPFTVVDFLILMERKQRLLSESSARKTTSLRHTRKLFIEDSAGFEVFVERLNLTQPLKLPYKSPVLPRFFGRLETICLDSSVRAFPSDLFTNLNQSPLPIEWRRLQSLYCQDMCFNYWTCAGSFGPAEYIARRTVIIHEAYFDSTLLQVEMSTIIYFVDCRCQACRTETSDFYRSNSCPFSKTDLVTFIVERTKLDRLHKRKILPKLTLYNNPPCTLKTPWQIIEKEVTPELRLEYPDVPSEEINNALFDWEEKFEDWKDEQRIVPLCVCCGKK
ncbi:hypothetical protein I204_08319 [Kwoniella mangroviensis CBS 8886]|nr:hypothetical protein I204_08319 [Kwoniella mangroviensis CBS 8886]